MNIKRLKLKDLKPLEENTRHHGDNQIKHFRESLRQFGQTRAFVVDEDWNILVGNGMWSAMQGMDGFETVDCHVLKGLSDAQKRKLVLSDNKIYSLGADNYDVIEDWLQDFAMSGDTVIAGYDSETIEALARSANEVMESMETQGVLSRDVIESKKAKAHDDDAVAFATTDEMECVEANETRPLCPHCGAFLDGGGVV